MLPTDHIPKTTDLLQPINQLVSQQTEDKKPVVKELETIMKETLRNVIESLKGSKTRRKDASEHNDKIKTEVIQNIINGYVQSLDISNINELTASDYMSSDLGKLARLNLLYFWEHKEKLPQKVTSSILKFLIAFCISDRQTKLEAKRAHRGL